MSEVEDKELDQTPQGQETEEEFSEASVPEDGDRSNSDSPASEEGGKGDATILAKRLRDTQDALRQKSEELARLRERMAVLESKLEQGSQERDKAQEPQQKPFNYLFDASVKETLYDDPENVLNVLRNTVSDIVSLLEARDAALMERMSQLSPDYKEIKERVDRLAKIPEFSGLDSSLLQRIARGLQKLESGADAQEQSQEGFRGVRPGPSGRRVAGRGGGGKSDVDRLADEFYRKIYGG